VVPDTVDDRGTTEHTQHLLDEWWEVGSGTGGREIGEDTTPYIFLRASLSIWMIEINVQLN
jgi:hypothetical protein